MRCDERLRTSAAAASGPPATCASTRASSTAAGGSASSTPSTRSAQGAFVARAMLGADEPYAEVPYFYSDLADWASLEYVGPAPRWDEEVVTGSLENGEFGVWYLEHGHVRGRAERRRRLDLIRAGAR